MNLPLHLTPVQWLELFTQFLSLSLLAIGGAITTAPDMHRFLVDDKHWLLDSQFSSSIALAQAAPGPNILFVALMGWNVGLNAGGGLGAGWHAWVLGGLGMSLAMLGIMLPSTTLTFVAARWGHRNRELQIVRAFKQGLAPIVVALMLATGWLLATTHHEGAPRDWPLWLITAVAAWVVWRTQLHLLWLLGAGALLGAMGWV